MSSKRLLSTKLRGVDLLLCESWDPLKVWDKGSDLKVIALEDLYGDSASWVE